MRFLEKEIEWQKAVALMGEEFLEITPKIRQKTKKILKKVVDEGKNYFFFGFLGPWEKLCYDILIEMRQTQKQIRLVHFQIKGEMTFTDKGAVQFRKFLKEENIKQDFMVFDGVFECPERTMVILKTTCSDRAQIMLGYVGLVLGWYQHELNDLALQKNDEQILQKDILDFKAPQSMCYVNFDYARKADRQFKVYNLAKENY